MSETNNSKQLLRQYRELESAVSLWMAANEVKAQRIAELEARCARLEQRIARLSRRGRGEPTSKIRTANHAR